MCKIDSSWEAACMHRALSLVLWDDREGRDGGEVGWRLGWEAGSEGGHGGIHITDLLHCSAET